MPIFVLLAQSEQFDDFSPLAAGLNDEIENFKSWCLNNHMTINYDKTKCLNINMSMEPLLPIPLLRNVVSLKILGLFFNEHLSWCHHFDYIISKMSRRLYVLRILRSLLSHDQLVEVFYAIVVSIMDYASPVFLNPGVGLNHRLVRICKRAFFIIHGNNKDCDRCNFLDVSQRREKLSMKLFNCARLDNSHVLHRLLPVVSTRSKRLILPSIRTSRRANGFVFACSILYNQAL